MLTKLGRNELFAKDIVVCYFFNLKHFNKGINATWFTSC